MMLTDHFSLEELTASEIAARKGIDNTPPPDVVANLHLLAEGLERVRIALGGRAIHVTSGYRCAELNRAVGGAARSDHVRGLAADILCPSYGPPLAVCRAIVDAGIEVDQLIHEFGHWTHVAFPASGAIARGDQLTIASVADGYQRGLLEIAKGATA